jgi:hypothetical protein
MAWAASKGTARTQQIDVIAPGPLLGEIRARIARRAASFGIDVATMTHRALDWPSEPTKRRCENSKSRLQSSQAELKPSGHGALGRARDKWNCSPATKIDQRRAGASLEQNWRPVHRRGTLATMPHDGETFASGSTCAWSGCS